MVKFLRKGGQRKIFEGTSNGSYRTSFFFFFHRLYLIWFYATHPMTKNIKSDFKNRKVFIYTQKSSED